MDGPTTPMEHLRLTCRLFWVDVRICRLDERWIASADTPDWPTLGVRASRGEASTSVATLAPPSGGGPRR